MGYLNLSFAAKTSRLAQILTDIDLGNAPVMDFYAGPPPATPDDLPEGDLLASLPCSSPFGAISNGMGDPEVTAAGGGYTSVPSFQLVGATGGSGAQFQVVMGVSGFAVTGGQSYSPNDEIRAPSNAANPAMFTVTSVGGTGAPTGVTLTDPGQFTGSLPTGPMSGETDGSGVGVVINITGYGVAGVRAMAPGAGYTSAGASGTALFTGGDGSGAAAAPSLVPVLTASAITTANAVSGGVCGMARIVNDGGLALAIEDQGSGGTDGTFALGVSGGTGTGFSGTFTVFGGEIIALQVSEPGLYTVVPTITTAASAGLSGALVVAELGAGVVDLDVGVAGSGASVILNATTIVSDGPVVVTSAYIAEA